MNPYEPILKEVASGILETTENKPNFSNDAFIDTILIFQTAFMDKMYDNQDYDQMLLTQRAEMVVAANKELRKLIHTYTGLDTIKLIEDYEK